VNQDRSTTRDSSSFPLFTLKRGRGTPRVSDSGPTSPRVRYRHGISPPLYRTFGSFFMSRDVSGDGGVISCGSPGSRPLPIDWCFGRSQVLARDRGRSFPALDWYGVLSLASNPAAVVYRFHGDWARPTSFVPCHVNIVGVEVELDTKCGLDVSLAGAIDGCW
jgi:hypothetical protein